MKNNILNNIVKNNLKICIYTFIIGAIPTYACIYYLLNSGFEKWFLVLLFGAMGSVMIFIFFKSIIVVIDPTKSDIFKKYGGIEEVEKIMNEIENTIEYEDNQIIVAKNYVADKKDFEKIIAYKDVLRVHKLVNKRNFVDVSYSVVITDKYNLNLNYTYPVKEEKKVNDLILLIGSKCNNAKIGYTKEVEEHIKKYKQKLPQNDIVKKETKENKEIKMELYACPDCNEKIEIGDKFCKNCGCKIDWT